MKQHFSTPFHTYNAERKAKGFTPVDYPTFKALAVEGVWYRCELLHTRLGMHFSSMVGGPKQLPFVLGFRHRMDTGWVLWVIIAPHILSVKELCRGEKSKHNEGVSHDQSVYRCSQCELD